ncbi:hypothetical protein ABZ897_01060 [Nonomuraea sp. NPDC046802]|uniref:hypothetical protein n=1 Tax=Nonomuraea sp. NPDC046802 TaxID=3154919 RepID=UPI0033F18698
MDPLTLSLIVAWAVVRALGETAWYGYQAVRQIPTRRRRAIDVGYDPAAPETKPFTWERVFRRRAEGRHAAAAVCALGAIGRGVLSLIGAPFTLVRQAGEGWQAGWEEQRRRLTENEEWQEWWKDWRQWWMKRTPPEPGTIKRPRFRQRNTDDVIVSPPPPRTTPQRPGPPSPPSPSAASQARPTVKAHVVNTPRPSGQPFVPLAPTQVALTRPAAPTASVQVINDREQRPPSDELPGRAASSPGTPLIAVIDRPTPTPTPAPSPALTEGVPDMSGQIATRAANTAVGPATRSGGTATPAPVAHGHEQAKRIGEAIVTRIASRLDQIDALKDNINSDMVWIASQINDLESAGIGGDLVALWLNALGDGDFVHQNVVSLAGHIVAMHGSARDALAAQRAAGDTMAAAKARAGEQNVAKDIDYY